MPETQISTLADLAFHVAGRYPQARIVRRCTPDGIDTYTGSDLFDRIRTLSLGLSALGVKAGDRVALMSDSRPEWVIADLAILTAGAVTVPIYPTLPAAAAGYILADSGAEVVIAADEAQAAKVREVRAELPQLQALVVIDAGDGEEREGETTLAADPEASSPEVPVPAGEPGEDRGLATTAYRNVSGYDRPPVAYRMSASRRMRPGELHYLDHPLFGLLVLVTRY